MRDNHAPLRVLSVVLAAALAVPAVQLVSVPLARAESAPAPDSDRLRRGLMWGAVALTGASLLGSGLAYSRYRHNVRLFNDHLEPSSETNGLPDHRCAVSGAGSGSATCARLLDNANSARHMFRVGLVVSGAAAVTALTLKLLEPDPAKPPAVEGWAMACAPIAGLGGTCTLRF